MSNLDTPTLEGIYIGKMFNDYEKYGMVKPVKIGRDAEYLAKEDADTCLEGSILSPHDIIEGNDPVYIEDEDCIHVNAPVDQVGLLVRWAIGKGITIRRER